MKLYKDKNWLKKQFIKNRFNCTEIAKICNVNIQTILNWKNRFNIKNPKSLYMNQKLLKKLYWKKMLNAEQISKMAKCSDATIYKWMKKFNIKRRELQEAHLGNKYYRAKNTYMDKKWLYKQYINKKLSTNKIAKLCNSADNTIKVWLIKFDIPLRNKSEAVTGELNPNWGEICPIDKREKIRKKLLGRKLTKEQIEKIRIASTGRKLPLASRIKMSGKNSPHWKGGKSFEPYGLEFNDILKEEIRRRDNHQCQICGIKQNGREFCVHHIDYDKNNNDPWNLITTCDSHNASANYNRDKWQMFFEIYQEIRKI